MSELLTFDFSPYQLTGLVYGTLVNDPQSLADLGDLVHQAPYKAPPIAPILYIKPRNTLSGPGAELTLPAGCKALEIGACLGIVIGRTACRVPEQSALEYVAGYTIVNDVTVPHDSFYRPSIRFRARDGFCPLGPAVVCGSDISNPDALAVRVVIDGKPVQQTTTAGRIRSVAKLVADVTDFMTLQAGDILLLGSAANAPLATAGQSVRIEIDGLGFLENRVTAEGKV